MNVPDTTPSTPAAAPAAAASADPNPATPPASAVSTDAAPAASPAAGTATGSAVGAMADNKAVATPAAADPAAAKKDGTDNKEGTDKPVAPEEYAKSVTLGDAEEFKGTSLNPDVIAAIVPTAQKLGIKPEQLSMLAQDMTRALAKQNQQIEAAEQKKFADHFAAQRQLALDTLKPEGIAEVRAALGKYMKPGSFLAHMVDMGLGNDLDFLNMCRDYGKMLKPDTAPGTGEGAGAGKGNYNWKEDWAAPGGAKQPS